jgi:hypothetical protein
VSVASFKGWQRVTIDTGGGKVEGIAPVVISASRATDIPSFYAEWFMQRLRDGFVRWCNRFTGRAQFVSFEKARAVVFWTKHANPMLRHLHELDARGINYYFTYTVNDYDAEKIELHVPPLAERIFTFRMLSNMIGKHRVVWRFDPLILTRSVTVDALLDKIHGVGSRIYPYTEKLVISFIDIGRYRKVCQNLVSGGCTDCREFSSEDINRIAGGLQEMNRQWGLDIATCAESADLSPYGITHNKCIDDGLMKRLFGRDGVLMDFLGCTPAAEGLLTETEGKRTKMLKDPGQRKSCRCVPSKDIGHYDTCTHGCLYCYATTSPNVARLNYQRHKDVGQSGESILCG